MPAFLTTHQLRFNDTDRLGHVNNGVFAVMLEQGRCEMLAEAGLPVGDGATSVVIVRLELDFVREMMWPGDVLIETELARLGRRSFTLQQRLVHRDEICGLAQTVLVVLDRQAKRSIAIDPWRAALEAFQP